jgi:hypothetical protein
MKRFWQILAVGLLLLPLAINAETISWTPSTTFVDNTAIPQATMSALKFHLQVWNANNRAGVRWLGMTTNGATSWTDNILLRANERLVPKLVPGDNVFVSVTQAYTGSDGLEYESAESLPSAVYTIPGGVVVKAPFAALSANPVLVMKGLCTVLTWITTDATSVSMDQGIGAVLLNGSRTVCPIVSTKYTLTATGPGGTATSVANVAVTAPAVGCNPPTGVTIK